MAMDAAKASDVTKKIVTFGETEDADIVGYDIVPSKNGVAFRAKCDSFDEEFKLGLTGIFNVSNALAAIAISYILDIPLENIKNGLKKARVEGRMEVFGNVNDDLTVIVDYAHNKMSFDSLFKSTREEYPGWKISIVFGCPGKKALGRRQILGEIAGRNADMIYITEEDEGEENVEDISREIAGHVEEAGGKYEIITDREQAVKKAILDAEPETVILITGKGRETRQKRGMQYIDTPSDVDYTLKFIAEKDEMQKGK
jgi:UDP-N-acetylmuramoyl-L-alanyl-D-glutamate--2,6-diaminopimelate ligase